MYMQTITYQQVKDFQERDAATLINVLSPEYFEKGHIPGSINIPLEHEDFTAQVEKVVGGKDMPLIVYCAGYTCDASKKAALKLDKAGFTNVMCYEGGTKEWQEKAPHLSAA